MYCAAPMSVGPRQFPFDQARAPADANSDGDARYVGRAVWPVGACVPSGGRIVGAYRGGGARRAELLNIRPHSCAAAPYRALAFFSESPNPPGPHTPSPEKTPRWRAPPCYANPKDGGARRLFGRAQSVVSGVGSYIRASISRRDGPACGLDRAIVYGPLSVAIAVSAPLSSRPTAP